MAKKIQREITPEEYNALVRATWSEAEFQVRVVVLANQLGWRVASFRKVRVQRANGSTYWQTPVGAQGKGWPDLFLVSKDHKCSPQRAIAAECKIGHNKPTPDQLIWLRLMAGAGIETHVWYPRNWNEILEALQ